MAAVLAGLLLLVGTLCRTRPLPLLLCLGPRPYKLVLLARENRRVQPYVVCHADAPQCQDVQGATST